MPPSRVSCSSIGVGVAAFFFSWGGVAHAQTTHKTFIDYFQPIPITCPLTTNAWGCTATGPTPVNCVAGQGVLPRDSCNGIESSSNPPGYYYWDGTVVHAPDGTYHLFADRWPGSSGFNPGWSSSDPIHAVGGTSALGPFTDEGYAYSNPSFGSDQHHGHNSQVVSLLDGTYAMVVSEVVPFTIFTATSLDGPWKPCSGSPGAGLSVPSAFGGNTSYASNISMVVRPDGNFEIIQRHGLIALSSSGVCGPYKAQQPTNTYPSSEAISSQFSASIYPNKTKHSDPMGPATVEATYVVAEDPVIWFSGGLYHVLYDYPGDRVGYHLTSPDGIHGWTDQGLAYDPRYAQKLFSYTDGTVNHWYKMERPSVVLENGHVTYLTFAVADVNKDNQIPAGSNHGSKVIVIPFDGAALDQDMGAAGMGGPGGSGGAAGSGGSGGAVGAAGSSGAGTAGSAGATGAAGTTGVAGNGGLAGASGAGGTTGVASGMGGGGTSGSTGPAGSPGSAGANRAGTGQGGFSGTDSTRNITSGGSSSGCSCSSAGGRRSYGASLSLLGLVTLSLIGRCRHRPSRRREIDR